MAAIETKTPVSAVDRKCLNLVSTLPPGSNPEGSIVFGGDFYNTASYIMDLKSSIKTELPQKAGEYMGDIFVSPDHQWLAYVEVHAKFVPYRLIVRNLDGNIQKAITWKPAWRQIAGWLDNENLILSFQSGKLEADSIIVFNPYTLEERQLSSDFPDLAPSVWLDKNFPWGGFNHMGAVYDPSLRYVAYKKAPMVGYAGVALLDLKLQKELAILQGEFGYQPKWSHDGKGFVINGTVNKDALTPEEYEELFFIDKNGNIAQLTHLNDSTSGASIGSFNWSPDDKKVAFWLYKGASIKYPVTYPDTWNESSTRLAIYDFDTGKVTDTCVPGYVLSDPIWSPDGNYIIVQDYYHPATPLKSHVYLLDLANQVSLRLAEDIWPAGWLK